MTYFPSLSRYITFTMMLFYAALHEHDPVFKKFAFSENISSLFSSLGYKRPAVIQSMYIFKVLFRDSGLLFI
jgi:hypothetical protein